MAADPKEIVAAVNDIRDALAKSTVELIHWEERANLIAAATVRACGALSDLANDEKYWMLLQSQGAEAAHELVDLWSLRDGFDRPTMEKLGRFLELIGYLPPDEAYIFVGDSVKSIGRAVARPSTGLNRFNAVHAESAARALAEEVCRRGDRFTSREQQRRVRYRLGRGAANAVGSALKSTTRALSGGLLGFASTSELSELLPGTAQEFVQTFATQDRVAAQILCLTSISRAWPTRPDWWL